MRLCGISSHFWLLSPCTGQVTHALLTRPPLSQRKTSTEISVPQCFVRLACVKHAASVHPEPGSNSLNNCLTQDNLWLSFIPHYCFGSFKPFLNVKNFQVLCVLLFSYQGSFCCPLRVSLTILSSRFLFVKNFFYFFQSFYPFLLLSDSSYILSRCFRFVKNFFTFFEVFICSCSCLSLPRDSLVIIPPPG